MKRERDTYILSTGRRFHCFDGRLSLGPGDDGLMSGYDNPTAIEEPNGDLAEDMDGWRPTPEERREIAEHMIALWKAWADK